MINRLKDLQIHSIYDFDNCLSINELLCKFYEKISECIKIANESIDVLEWVKQQGLSEEVTNLLEIWCNDGTMEGLINDDKFNTIKTECTSLVNSLRTELVNTISQNVNDLSLDITDISNRVTQNENDIEILEENIESVRTGYINAVNSLSTSTSNNYQKKTDNSLDTTAKNVVEAINEVNQKATINSSNSNNGYVTLSNGLTIQWGTAIIQTSDYVGETTVIFPVEFKLNFTNIISMCDMTAWLSVYTKDVGFTKMTLCAKANKGAQDEKYGIGAVRVNWLAIGVV